MNVDAYAQWIDMVEGPLRAAVHFTKPAQLLGQLRYAVLVPGPATLSDLGRVVDTLVAQDNLCWELLMPTFRGPGLDRVVARYSAEVQRRIVFVDCRAAADRGAVLKNLCERARAEWCIVADADDTITSRALDEFDHALAGAPDAWIMYGDEDDIAPNGTRSVPCFKPGHSPQMLQSYNYYGRLTALAREPALAVGGFRAGGGAGAEWSLNLRLAQAAEEVGAPILRLPYVLCHRAPGGSRERPHPMSQAAAQCRAALVDHWRGLGIAARVTTQSDGTQRSTWRVEPQPLVSVVIPNHNKPDLLRLCTDGLLEKTDYDAIEIIVVENNSTDPEIWGLYDELQRRPNVRVLRWDAPFNYSAACNRGAEFAKGELLLFLNNDIEVVDAGWLNEMVRVAMLPGVGVVGTKLNYPDGTLQHAGVALGIHLYALMFNRAEEAHWGLFGSPNQMRNWLAIMGACQMVRRSVFDAVGRFDEAYRIANSDVALCLRAYKAGWHVAYTPYAALIHHEGKTRGHSNPPEDMVRSALEVRRLGLDEDPFLHPQLASDDPVPRLFQAGERSIPDNIVYLERLLLQNQQLPDAPLDLANDFAAQELTGLRYGEVLWRPQSPAAVRDEPSAARFLMDVVRRRPDLRLRFPRALTEGAKGAFLHWLRGEGRAEFPLDEAALDHIAALLDGDYAARVRQQLLFREDIRAVFPLGFLPIQRRGLFKWMMDVGRVNGPLAVEEIWWFFLACAERPGREFVRSYDFTPLWQRQHPFGLTIFGREALAVWVAEHYGLSLDQPWLAPDSWEVEIPAAEQIRLAYDASPRWRAACPEATRSEPAARALLAWLAGPDGGLTEPLRRWCAARLDDGTATAITAEGVNVIAHFCFPSGLRVSAEAMCASIETSGLKVSTRDLRTLFVDDPRHASFTGRELYDVTVIHAQPEPFFDTAHARADLDPRRPRTHRVAYWYWELDAVPAFWRETAKQTDEVWAATTFVADALRPVVGRPVHTLFPGVRLGRFQPRSRRYFGLPGREDGRFAFQFSFHMGSVMERKNPLGLIRAFARAFDPGDPVDLVLKTTTFGHHDEQIRELKTAGGSSNIHIVDRVLSSDENIALMDSCDAYVSLHRSEGLGLTLAEAMLLGKPVIATRYSGNLDFMDDRNSLLVDCDITPIGKPTPPYSVPGARWADPDIEHAAALMRRVFDDEGCRRALGARGQADAERSLSPEAAGRRFAERLAAIRREREADARSR